MFSFQEPAFSPEIVAFLDRLAAKLGLVRHEIPTRACTHGNQGPEQRNSLQPSAQPLAVNHPQSSCKSIPPVDNGSSHVLYDSDGDLDMPRKPRRKLHYLMVEILLKGVSISANFLCTMELKRPQNHEGHASYITNDGGIPHGGFFV